MLVEVELNKPLIRGTYVRFEGERKWVMFKYEQLPLFCFYCGKIGHGERNCQKKMLDAKNANLMEGQFGEWMRGNAGQRGNRIRIRGPMESMNSGFRVGDTWAERNGGRGN